MESSDLAFYLYCLAPSGHDIQCSVAGVDGHRPVLVCNCGEICAVYSEVELEEFLGESAEAHLQDLVWLGPRVCSHEAVIEQIMSLTSVLPARFATIFSSLENMKQFVLEHRDAIAGFFAELGEKQEWAVKGKLDRALALEKLKQSTVKEQVLDASPGMRYFHEKQIKVQLEREFNQRLRAFCKQTAAVMAVHAGGFMERKVLAAVADETEGEVISNWAFLISPEALDNFRANLERFNSGEAFPGLKLVLTGPWPPYSFAPDLSGGAVA
jgi:hypothetical protein